MTDKPNRTGKPSGRAIIPPRRNPVVLSERDGTLIATWPTWCYRFLFSDGRTLDVHAAHDNSDLREAVLNHANAERIEGVARISAHHDDIDRERSDA